jgi:hypothetical protein
MGLTINSKYRIATDTTMCAMPETGRCCSGPRSRSTNLCANHTCFVAALGFFCDVGGSYFLPRLANNNIAVGMYYALTGARLTGYDTLYVLARLLACLLALSLSACVSDIYCDSHATVHWDWQHTMSQSINGTHCIHNYKAPMPMHISNRFLPICICAKLPKTRRFHGILSTNTLACRVCRPLSIRLLRTLPSWHATR